MATRMHIERETVEQMLKHDHYTPEELADLLGMNVWTVRHAARTGELPAFIADHHVLCIRREDAVHWLADRIAH